ncbi:hypothetical protein ACSBR2_022889 [Camellia fascicularis]
MVISTTRHVSRFHWSTYSPPHCSLTFNQTPLLLFLSPPIHSYRSLLCKRKIRCVEKEVGISVA